MVVTEADMTEYRAFLKFVFLYWPNMLKVGMGN